MNTKMRQKKTSFLDIFFYIVIIILIYIYSEEKIFKSEFDHDVIDFASANPNHSINDLMKIKNALKSYHNEYGKYPISTGFNGFISCWGYSGSDWIPGLAPKFIPYLPNNLNNSKTCHNQYLYFSNGKGYKLIHHMPDDCQNVLNQVPSLIDPRRTCWAYGFWTKNATSH